MKDNVLKLLLKTLNYIQSSIDSKVVDIKRCKHVF